MRFSTILSASTGFQTGTSRPSTLNRWGLPLGLLTILLLAGSTAWGQLAGWDFSTMPSGVNNYGPSPYTATTTDGNTTVGGLTRGAGVTTTGSGTGSAWGGNGFDLAGGGSMATAITAGNYVTFTIAANTGYVLSLSDMESYHILRSGAGAMNGQWQYQKGAGTFVNIGTTITWLNGDNAYPALSLGGIADLQTVPAGTVITFRIVSWGTTNNAGTWAINEFQTGNDFVVNGSLGNCNTPPIAGGATTATTCAGVDVMVDGSPTSGTGTYTHEWIDLGTGTATGVTIADPTSQIVTVSALTDGTINLQYKATDSGSCTGTKNVVITVNPSPVGTLTETDASGNTPDDSRICAGGSATFTATSGFTNYNFKVNSVSIQSGASAVYTTSGLSNGDDVEVEVTDGLGCQATFTTATMVVYPLPTGLSIAADDNSVCAGTNVTLTATPGYANYDFRINGLPAPGGNGPSNTYSSTTLNNGDNIIVNVTNANGCTAAVGTVTMTIYALPTPTFTSAPGANTCASTDVTYTTEAGQSNYIWSVAGTVDVDYTISAGGTGTGSNTVTLQWLTPGSKTVTVNYTDANGCSGAAASSTTTVNALPLVDAGTYGTVCADAADIVLTGSPSGGTFSGTGVTGNNFDPSVGTQTITYSYTDGNGCTNTDPTTITINPLPVVAPITGSNYIYTNNTTQLANATGGGIWASSNMAIATVDNTGLVFGVSQGTSVISYTVTDGNGCTNSSTLTVIVNQPILDIGLFNFVSASPAGNKLKVKIRPTQTVVGGVYSDGVFTIRCLTGSGVTFTNLGSIPYGYIQTTPTIVNDGGYDYFSFNLTGSHIVNWPINVEVDVLTLGYSCTVNPSFEIVPTYLYTDPMNPANTLDGSYYQELNAGGAQNIIYTPATTPVTLLSISAASDSPACVGESINLSSTPAGGTGAYSAFAWSGPNAYTAVVEDPAAFTSSVAAAGVYTVTVTDAGNGCTASNSTTVLVPVPAVTATGGSFTQNQTVVLTANAPTAVSYAWSGPNSYAGTGNPATPAPASNASSTGTYTVIVTDANGCTNSATAEVIIYPADLYVNDNSQVGDTYTSAVGDDNNLGTAASPLRTIQKAINVSVGNNIIYVDGGTYREDIIVSKTLDIRGSNYGISPNGGTRVGEAIIQPATSAVASGEIIHVAASNVSINGFIIDGDNTALTSGFTGTNGADIDAAEGVTIYENGISSLHISKNTFRNLSYFTVSLVGGNTAAATSGHIVTDNHMENLGTYDAASLINRWGGGVLLSSNQYASITDNTMTNVRIGVQTDNFYRANPGAATYQVIDNNTMSVRRLGVFHNLHYTAASPFTFSNNNITGIVNANETVWDGILLASLSVPSTSQDNTIDGSAVSNPSEGYEVWQVNSVSPATITGGSVTGVATGLFVNNYEGYNSNATNGAHASVSGLSLNPLASGVGIRLHDNPASTHANVQLTIGAGVTITGGTKGLVVENASASIVGGTLSDLSFTGQTGNYVELITNTGSLNATAASFGGQTGASASLVQNFAIEDKIVHKIDNGALGFVLVKTAHDFVTVNSFSTPNTTPNIQRGVDAASTGFTVNVGAGSFNNDVIVNKQLTLLGAGIDVTTVSGPIGGAGSSTFQFAASGIIFDGFTVTRDGNNTTDWNNAGLNSVGLAIQSQTNNEVRNSKFDGNRTGIDVNNSNGNNIHNNIISNNRTGLLFRNQTDNTTVTENTITDNWTVGILFLDASSGSNSPVQTAANSMFNNNDLSDNWYGEIVDRQTGGSLPAPGANLKNFECNWYGTTLPVVSTANSTEPGYAAQIPVVYGGSAMPPGGQPDILGAASANFDYVSWLINGMDDQPTPGFQPVPGSCLGSPVIITLALQTNVYCFGSTTGALDITPSGGSGSYTYLWSNAATTQDISGLAAGSYSVTVTDATYGATASATYTITQPAAALTATAGSNSPQYAGGTLNLTSMPAGGTPAYTYLWTGPNTFASTVQNPSIPSVTVAANGTYSLTVTDANGCSVATSTNVVIYGTSFYVNDNVTTGDHYTTAVGSNANPGTQAAPFATLTYAISIAQPGNTIWVDAGTYVENPTVSKALTINGSNQGIAGSATRTFPESVVQTNGNQVNIVNVTASNVIFDGFSIEGDDPSLTGSATTSGEDANATYAVRHTGAGLNNLTVRNNIIKHTAFGFRGTDALSSGNIITANWFDAIGAYDFGYGVSLRTNYYADVTNNKMTRVWTGIHTSNHSGASGPASWSITGNEVHSYAAGLWYNLEFNNGTSPTISNNQFSAEAGAVTNNYGMQIISIQDAVNPVFTNNTVTGTDYGIIVWNTPTSNSITLGSTNSVSGTKKAGIFFTNNLPFNAVGTTPFGAAGAASTLRVNGIAISSASTGTGIIADATGGSATTLNFGAPTTLTNGLGGLSVIGSAAAITGNTLNNLTFVGQTGNYIELVNNAGNLDATATLFDSQTGATATLAQNFAIEDKIVHKIDNSVLGFVLVKTAHDFVTVNSFVTPATTIASIQRGVNAASNGFTVNVAAGTYTDNVTVDKEVSILGASQALTFVQPLISNPNCGGGGGGSLCAGGSNVFLVQANNVSIQQLTVDGNNPAITSGTTAGGSDLDARNGIITNHNAGVFNNLTVNNVTVKNIYLRGMYASSGGSFTFSNNTVDNVQADPGSIAMFNFGGSGAFTNNMVSNANDGIASNHSTGTTYSGNAVTSSGSGIHTDNNGDGGGTGDIIQNNTVTNSTAGGYGIFVFAPYLVAQVKENTITNVDVGLANAGQGAAVTTLFTQNTVDGMNKANSTGIYQTTDVFGFGFSNVSGNYTNNFIRNNTDGFYLEYHPSNTNAITVNGNAITANTNGVTLNNLGGTLVNDFECNWWGATSAAGVAAAVGGAVDYTPWRTDGTDSDLVTTGFQPTGPCVATPVVIDAVVADNVVCGETSGSLDVTFSGGTGPYNIAWTGGSAMGVTSVYTIPGLLAGTYGITVTDVNLSTATATAQVLSLPVTNVTQTLYYPTIQAAINAANPNDVITACAGTYAENLIVNKALSIRGPNYGISPNGGVRVPEATILPATSDIDGLVMINVGASNVSIDGFVINGDNTGLNSTFLGTNGADLDAYEAVGVVLNNISSLNVSHNIIRNISYFGVDLLGDGSGSAPATAGHVINDNLMQDFGTYNNASGIALWGGGVLLYNNQYASVTNNTMTNMRIGIQTGNYSQANPGAATYQVIDNNTISARRRGIFHNLHYSAASAFTLSNNDITAVADANETLWDGILLASLSVPSTSQDNTIDGSAVSNPSEGYEVWQVNSVSPATITGGSVSGVGIGLFVNNYDGYPSAGSDAPFGGHATVSGLSISPLASGTGIRLRDNPLSTHANVQLGIGTGVTITGGTKGLWLENASASIVGGTLSNLAFTGQTGNYIELVNNAGNLDATTATFGGLTGASATLPQNFAIEDKIVHKIDNGALGFVLVKTANDFVTVNSFIAPATTTPSIQRGVNAASTGFTVNVNSGTYNEQVLVNKSVTVLGTTPKPVVDFTGTVTGKPTLFDVSVDGVTVDNMNFKVDLSKLKSAIIASGSTIDNIAVQNNVIDAYGAPSAGTYGDRNAVSVNFVGSTNYRVAASGVNNVTFTGNTVNGTGASSYFRSGISADEVAGTFTGNTLNTINQDIQVRFVSNGAVTISNNNLNGGGVEVTEPNPSTTTISITDNIFAGTASNDVTPNTAVLRLKNNQQNKATTISGNTFTDKKWAISLENYPSVSIDNNDFTPLAGSTDFLHIGVNTKSISSNSNTIVQTTVNGSITNNTFNGSGTVGGTGIGFFNHDSDNATFGAFTIGSAGNENEFNAQIGQFIRLDNQTGSTDPATNPTDYTDGGGSVTTMACWNQDYDIQNNKFDVGAGLQLPAVMNAGQRMALEAALFHKPDAACTGTLLYFLPVHNLTQNTFYLTIQSAVNAAVANDVIECAEWTFNERVTIDKTLTLQGSTTNESLHVINGTGLAGTGSGIRINNGITGVTIKNLTVQNFSGAGGNTDAGIYGIGGNSTLTVDNVALLNNPNASGFYANGPVSTVSITNSTVTNNGAGARGIVIWNGLKQNITISNNVVTNNVCCGIELQDGTASDVDIIGNTIDIGGGDNAIGLIGLNNSIGANLIQNNIITGGGRYGIEIKNPNGGVTVNNNSVTLSTLNADLRDRAGIAIFRRDFLAGNPQGYPDVPTGVTITNNTVTGYTQTAPEEGFGIVVEGVSHTVTGNTLNGNNVGLQLQGGGHANANYAANTVGSGDQAVGASPNYFGRGNAPYICDIVESGNTFSGNTVARRMVTAAGVFSDPGNMALINNQLAKEVILDNGVTQTTYCSIQAAVNASVGSGSETVNVGSGAAQTTYDEQVLVNKDVTITGAGATKPVVTFTGTVTGKPTLFDVSQPGVTIDNLEMRVDLVKLSSAIIASATDLDNLAIKNNDIKAIGSSTAASFGSYGNRNAVSINYVGNINYKAAAGGVDNILFQGNTVIGALAANPVSGGTDRLFRAGVCTDESGGTFTGNTLQSINQDIQVRFASNGDVNITNNILNGGGAEVSEHLGGAGNINVTGNTFNGASGSTYTSALRLKNNTNAKTTTVSGNTFTGHNWGISLENYQAVTITTNNFTPAANSTTYRHITVNTKEISSSSGFYAPVVGATITANTFNGSGAAGGIGLAFYNHDNDSPVFGPFVIGSVGNENMFASGIGTFIRLDNSNGPTATGTSPNLVGAAGFPEYGGNTAVTTMACWDVDINIERNKFDVGAGLQLPVAMTGAQRTTLEGKLFHMPDNACLGELIYFQPVIVHAKVFLQGPYDSSTPLPHLMRDNLRQIAVAPFFPTTEPYSQYNTAPYNFAFAHMNGGGGETITNPSVLTNSGPNAIVDWVYLELRNKLDYTQVMATRSALVQRDGDIVDVDGTSSVLFPNSYLDQYYLMVRHRNHLGAMTATPIDLTNGATFTDFSSPALATFGTTTTSARRLLEPGVYGLWAGNLNLKANGTSFQIKYTGGFNDPFEIVTRVGPLTPLNVVSGYYIEDANLNGSVRDRGANNDRSVILNNVGPTTPGVIITQEPQN